LAERFIL